MDKVDQIMPFLILVPLQNIKYVKFTLSVTIILDKRVWNDNNCSSKIIRWNPEPQLMSKFPLWKLFQGKYGNKRFVLHSFIHSFHLNQVSCPVHVVVHMVAIQLQRKRDKQLVTEKHKIKRQQLGWIKYPHSALSISNIKISPEISLCQSLQQKTTIKLLKTGWQILNFTSSKTAMCTWEN